jgi:hypothetical protein
VQRGAGSTLKIAAYTYTMGYRTSPLQHARLVPSCRRVGVDCFYFVTNAAASANGTFVWRANGWRLRPVVRRRSTAFVASSRLTSKYFKFILLEEPLSYDWVVSFDDAYHIRLDGLAPLVREHNRSVLLAALDTTPH